MIYRIGSESVKHRKLVNQIKIYPLNGYCGEKTKRFLAQSETVSVKKRGGSLCAMATASDDPGIVIASACRPWPEPGPGSRRDNLTGSRLTDRTRGATDASPVKGVSGIKPGHLYYTTTLIAGQ